MHPRTAACLLVLCAFGTADIIKNTVVLVTRIHPKNERIDSSRKLGRRSSHLIESEEVEKAIVDFHNAERRKVGSSNMVLIQWDRGLANHVKRWLKNCIFEQATSYTPWKLRQNLGNPLKGRRYKLFTDGIQEWVDQKDNFNYRNKTCKDICHNYVTMVKWDIIQVGCSAVLCDNLDAYGRYRYRVDFIGCEYYTPFNAEANQPYAKGAACSLCSTRFSICSTKLCTGPKEVYPPWNSSYLREKGSQMNPTFAMLLSGHVIIKLSLKTIQSY